MIALSEWLEMRSQQFEHMGHVAEAASYGAHRWDHAVREDCRAVPPIPTFPGKETGR